MSSKPRYVFDTNVVISALLFEQRIPGRAFYFALDHGDILLSEDVAQEINDVLTRKKFSRYLTLEERELFLQWFIRETRLVEITEKIQECRDPRDNRILELAVSGKASHIISGDKDLLALNPFRGIHVLTPSEFLEALVTGRR